jgi:hypothetical protein
MKITTAWVLAAAVAGLCLAGCEADESAPSRPRTKAILPTGDQSRENAEKRELEAPKRDMPTAGSEFPGQSRANTPTDAPMVTLVDLYGTKYHGPLPMLPEKPGMTPAAGYTSVPGTPWVIEHAWGESLPLADYNHRAWTDTKTEYVRGGVAGNPTYVVPLPDNLTVPQCEVGSDVVRATVGTPWFYCNTVLMPVMMCFKCPWSQETTARLGLDPLYFGYLPPTGAVVPSPQPGEFKFRTDFNTVETPATLPNY